MAREPYGRRRDVNSSRCFVGKPHILQFRSQRSGLALLVQLVFTTPYHTAEAEAVIGNAYLLSLSTVITQLVPGPT